MTATHCAAPQTRHRDRENSFHSRHDILRECAFFTKKPAFSKEQLSLRRWTHVRTKNSLARSRITPSTSVGLHPTEANLQLNKNIRRVAAALILTGGLAACGGAQDETSNETITEETSVSEQAISASALHLEV